MRDEITVPSFETDEDRPGGDAVSGDAGPDSSATGLSPDAATTGLPPPLRLPVANFRELTVRMDPASNAIYCSMTPSGRPCMTPRMISELHELKDCIIDTKNSSASEDGLKFYVMKSAVPGIFNLGGDLNFFMECIAKNDRYALGQYALDCVKLIYSMDQSFGADILTVCLVQGDALGGGFEAALSFNVLVAERGAKMGLPETLFNAFPGMGAYSLLSRKIGPVEAERMILSGKIYLAEELHEMGVVSVLAEPGRGDEAVRTFLSESQNKSKLLLALNKVRRRVVPITFEELEEVTDIWVDNAMSLSGADLRRMKLLAQAQLRRMKNDKE